MAAERVAVLLAAGAAPWEVVALRALDGRDPRVVLLKRCVDLADLVATALTGQSTAAVIAAELDGLDAEAVATLARAGVAVVVVRRVGGPDLEADRIGRLGLRRQVDEAEVAGIAEVVLGAVAAPDPEYDRVEHERGDTRTVAPAEAPPRRSWTVAVWGPTGAPGRTTVAVGLGAELAQRGLECLLVDADCHGGAVAQHLGVLDESSGLLAAARQANSGHLDPPRLTDLARGVSPRLRVLTGLPRPDRWGEVREAAFEGVLDAAGELGDVLLLDLGFDLDPGPGLPVGPVRATMARTALARADDVVVVGSADPVGLTRLARGLVDLLAVVPGPARRSAQTQVPRPQPRLHVVVNRTRPSLGWGERDIRRMVEGFLQPATTFFLPDDRAAADRALMQGRTLVELGDSPLRRALHEVAGAVVTEPAAASTGPTPRGRVRLRRAGTGR